MLLSVMNAGILRGNQRNARKGVQGVRPIFEKRRPQNASLLYIKQVADRQIKKRRQKSKWQ